MLQNNKSCRTYSKVITATFKADKKCSNNKLNGFVDPLVADIYWAAQNDIEETG
jgi:hypothetical protein